MFDFLGKNKILIMIVVVSFIVFFVLRNFISVDSGQDDLLVAKGPAESDISRDFVTLLFQLSSLQLDESVFKDDAFVSLQDFGLEVVSQPYGRENPFAPLEGGGPIISTSKQ